MTVKSSVRIVFGGIGLNSVSNGFNELVDSEL